MDEICLKIKSRFFFPPSFIEKRVKIRVLAQRRSGWFGVDVFFLSEAKESLKDGNDVHQRQSLVLKGWKVAALPGRLPTASRTILIFNGLHVIVSRSRSNWWSNQSKHKVCTKRRSALICRTFVSFWLKYWDWQDNTTGKLSNQPWSSCDLKQTSSNPVNCVAAFPPVLRLKA